MFEFRPAVRDKTSVLLALSGPTGCGKTYTALLTAVGLAYPHMSNEEILAAIKAEGKSRIFFIDTEGGRGKHYAPGPGKTPDFEKSFPYEYGQITAPYTPEVYTDAIQSADAAGAWVIILDSTSHEYESEGGLMELADEQEAGKLKPGKTLADANGRDGWQAWEIKPVKSPGNWKEPKTRHKRMVNRAIQARAHVIFCLRAEEKMLLSQEPKLDNQGNPKMWQGRPQMQTVVIPAADRPLLERWQPICEKRFMYEMTVSFLLLADRPGTAIPFKTLQGAFRDIFAQDGQRIGRAHGEKLADWSAGREDSTVGDGRPKGHAPMTQDESRAMDGDPPAAKPKRTDDELFEAYVRAIKATTDLDGLIEVQARSNKFVARIAQENPALHEKILSENAYQHAALSGGNEGD